MNVRSLASAAFFGLVFLPLLLASTSCNSNDHKRSSAYMAPDQDGSTGHLTEEDIGKRITVWLPRKYNEREVTGTLQELYPDRDMGVIRMDTGAWIGEKPFRLSDVVDVVYWKENEEAKRRAPSPAERERVRFSSPPSSQDLEGAIRAVWIDFRHEHTLAPDKKLGTTGCLVDMAEHVRRNPSGLLFAETDSQAVLSVPVPDDAKESLIPWQWHAHLLTGSEEKPSDRRITMNLDGKVVVDFENVELPATLVFVGTPVRIRHGKSNLDAFVPPRVLSLRVLPAETAEAVLKKNPTLVDELQTSDGTLFFARAPLNETEMLLATYDPKGDHEGLMSDVRYSVQDALLLPAYTIDVIGKSGEIRQRLGGYPVAPIVSHDTPDTSKIHLEMGPTKFTPGASPPMLFRVNVPEKATVKADVDVRSYGVTPDQEYTIIVGHGQPKMKGKEIRFSPRKINIKAGDDRASVGLDFTNVKADAFPAQVFVWHQASAKWNEKAGYLPSGNVVKVKRSPTTSRRMQFRPAAAPHLKYIRFSGPELDPMGATSPPPAVAPYGGTIGRGGANSPVSFEVGGPTVKNDRDKKDGSKPKIPTVSNPTAIGIAGAPWVGPINTVVGPQSQKNNQIVRVTVNCCCKGQGAGNGCGESVPTGGHDPSGDGHREPVPTEHPGGGHFPIVNDTANGYE